MKKTITLVALVMLLSIQAMAQYETCAADANQIYYTNNAGWTQSEWYPIINIDAEQLTNEGTGLAAHSGVDGTVTSSTFSTGVFKTPVYNVDANMNPVATQLLWPVKYYMACLTPTFFNSAYTKIVINGAASWSAKGNVCFDNNNSIKQSPIWNKRGFIELSRFGSAIANTPPSRHGFIEMNDLPQVERVQFSFSSTAWRRGFKLDIKHNEGNWEPLQWEPSDLANGFSGFAEQGYAFEVMINKQEDPTSKISLRWRIWDGDSIHQNVSRTDGSTYSLTMTPFASRQVVRIHQIKIFSGVVPTEAPSAVRNPSDFFLHIYRSGNNIAISEVAKVEVFAINGKKMFAGETNLINARNFDKGVYLIKATGADGRVQNQKIIL